MATPWAGKWESQTDGIQWMTDSDGRVIGYKDDLGRHFEIPQNDSTPEAMAAKEVPASALTAAEAAAVRGLVSGARSPAAKASYRPYGLVSNVAVEYTFHLTCRAPAHYDGVQITLHNISNSGANAFSASVCAPARANGSTVSSTVSGRVPQDAAGSTMSFTALTFGTTNPDDTRNPGGGASTVLIQNVAGSVNTLREGYAVSDYLPLSSLDRTDIVGAPPLFMLRVRGTSVGNFTATEISDLSANPFNLADPDFCGGYWAGDQTAVSAPGAMVARSSCPAVTVHFFLRGSRVSSIGVAGDSLEQGWVASTTSPLTAGLIDGWPRKLVRLLNAAGSSASLTQCAQVGNYSQLSHERAYGLLLTGALTHLFIKPWSVNEAADGITGIPAALSRTSRLIQLCRSKQVVPIIVRPWAGQSISSAPGLLVQTYCDNAAHSGVPVLDCRALVGGSTTSDTILDAYVCKTSGGAAVDAVHINDAGHAAVAAAALAQRAAFGM